MNISSIKENAYRIAHQISNNETLAKEIIGIKYTCKIFKEVVPSMMVAIVVYCKHDWLTARITNPFFHSTSAVICNTASICAFGYSLFNMLNCYQNAAKEEKRMLAEWKLRHSVRESTSFTSNGQKPVAIR